MAEKEANTTQEQPETAAESAERQELEEFRAEKARKEAAAKAAVNEDGSPNLNLDPKNPAFNTLSVEDQIRAHYIHARGTIQDYARMFGKTVDDVLVIIGQPEMSSVSTTGDLIDAGDLGPTDAPIRAEGQPAKPPYTLN